MFRARYLGIKSSLVKTFRTEQSIRKMWLEMTPLRNGCEFTMKSLGQKFTDIEKERRCLIIWICLIYLCLKPAGDTLISFQEKCFSFIIVIVFVFFQKQIKIQDFVQNMIGNEKKFFSLFFGSQIERCVFWPQCYRQWVYKAPLYYTQD